MPTQTERDDFSKRLTLALRRATPRVEGATQLAAELSLRYADGVSVQTAHKWLTGRTVPSHDKTAVMAEWLGVEEHWLRYGPGQPAVKRAKTTSTPPSKETLNLARKIEALDSHQRYLVEELVGQLFETSVR